MDNIDYRFLGNIDKEKADIERSARVFKNIVDSYIEVGFSRQEAIIITLELTKASFANRDNTERGE